MDYLVMKYEIRREGPDGFRPTGEIFDAGDVTPEDANAAAQARVEQLHQESGGVGYAAEIIRE
jgi:hypothetical protein